MHPDRKTHHEKDKDDPFVGAGFIGMVLPFEDGPEDQGGKEGGRGIDFPLDGAVPEGITEGIGQGADDAGAHDGKDLLAVGFAHDAFHDEFAGEMGDGPEQEEDGKAAGDGAHEIDAAGGGMRVIAKKDDKEAAHEDEEGRAGRVGDLELVTTGNEFAAIPEAAGGFHGHYKNSTGDHTHDPTYHIIHSFEIHNRNGFFNRFQRFLRLIICTRINANSSEMPSPRMHIKKIGWISRPLTSL